MDPVDYIIREGPQNRLQHVEADLGAFAVCVWRKDPFFLLYITLY